jgi:hypothetical protein
VRQKLESPQGENKEGVQKLARAACTILECIGEEPTREGLRATPERYANAMLYPVATPAFVLSRRLGGMGQMKSFPCHPKAREAVHGT